MGEERLREEDTERLARRMTALLEASSPCRTRGGWAPKQTKKASPPNPKNTQCYFERFKVGMGHCGSS